MKINFIVLSVLFSQSVFADDIKGNWSPGCNESGEASYKVTVGYTADNDEQLATWDVSHFSDKTCETKTKSFEYIEDYKIGPEVENGYEIDRIHKNVTLTVDSQAEVDKMNTDKFCGFEDWAVGAGKVLNGLTCGEKTYRSVGDGSYDIFKVSTENDVKSMRLGAWTEEKDGSSPDKRPDVLEDTVYMSVD